MVFPDDYPLSPPRVKILNTGGGKVRFGPNLYANGKVSESPLPLSCFVHHIFMCGFPLGVFEHHRNMEWASVDTDADHFHGACFNSVSYE